MKRIYMDNAATTRVTEPVLTKMLPYLTEQYGNPMSVHAFGRAARRAVDEACAREAPRWAYVRGILDSWRAAGLKTPEQVMSASKGPRGFPPGDPPCSIQEKIVFH